MAEGRKPLIILSSLLPNNLFTDKALMTLYILGNRKQIQLTSLLDTGATGIAFVDKAMARTICEALEISLIRLSKPKPLKGFDSRPAPSITHAIYFTLTV